MIVDAWIQHPGPRMLADPMFEPLRRWTRGRMPGADAASVSPADDAPIRSADAALSPSPEGDLPLSATLAALDAAGVQQALLSAWAGPQGALIANDEVADAVARSGGRLSGVGAVDIRRPMAAMREVRRCVEELGFKAIRILPWLWEVPPTDRRFYPVYAACCEMGVPLCTQIGHTGPLMPSEVGRPIYLDQVAIDFPELTIVAGHIGYPWTDEAVAVATKHPNVYIDTSAYAARRYPPALVDYLRGHGRRKVLFGSNWPMIPPAQCLQGLDALGLDDETRALFLGGNARRVYRL